MERGKLLINTCEWKNVWLEVLKVNGNKHIVQTCSSMRHRIEYLPK